ncbi:hypothetical protein RJ639_041264 [Escallonia herrerae]|uniref:RING-type domain-containing protein n=1 Tax=Escallonia herrerae TaxID=1293975 RepID=A0AA89B5R0_9ASTE|nr:hypothetical protein RJ639_041264 [Escallonia herrerae]
MLATQIEATDGGGHRGGSNLCCGQHQLLGKGSEFPVVRCFQPKLRGLVLFQYRLRAFTLIYQSRAPPSITTPLFTETPSHPKTKHPCSQKLHLTQKQNTLLQFTETPSLPTQQHALNHWPINPFHHHPPLIFSAGESLHWLNPLCLSPLFLLEGFGGTCSICHEDFVPRDMVNRLPCSHIFHTRCILRWLKRSNTCPLCRSKVHKEEPARPKETHGQPIRIMRLDRQSFHRVPTSQSRPAPTSRNVTRSVENEAHIPQSRPTPTARNVIPSVQNEDHGDAVSCVTLDEAGDTVMIDA